MTIVGIGNIYVETNCLDLQTGGSETLKIGAEYRAGRYETRLGGSVVNFVVQAEKLGTQVGLIGKRGNDPAGDALIELLAQAGIASDLIVASDDVQTSVGTGIVFAHSGREIQFVAGNANQSLGRKDITTDHQFFNTVDAVYLGGFLKQESLYADYPELIQTLKSKGIRVFMDHGRVPVDVSAEKLDTLLASLAHVEGYFPNEDELRAVTKRQKIDEALNAALAMGPKLVVVKLGEKGCAAKTATETAKSAGHSVDVVSTIGAGDAFNAAFITQYLAGSSLQECADFANATAALRVSQNEHPNAAKVREFRQTH